MLCRVLKETCKMNILFMSSGFSGEVAVTVVLHDSYDSRRTKQV
jgi:hypothetical protein